MKKTGARNISIVCFIMFLILLIGLWICIGNDEISQIIIKIVYSILSVILLVYVFFQIQHYYVTNIQFTGKGIIITEKHKHIEIPYIQIKNVQYVMRRVIDSKKDKGIQIKDIDNFRGYSPYYDLINDQNELLETIDLDLFNEHILNKNFLQRGIEVYSKTGFMKPVKRTMSGKVIDKLRECGIYNTKAQNVREYINYYNSMITLENDRKTEIGRYVFSLGLFVCAIFLAVKYISFLIVGVICIVFSIGWKQKINLKPFMQISDEYKAGCVFWGDDVNEFIVFFENGEMKRKDISASVQVKNPVLNDINYCVVNAIMDIVLVGKVS